MEFRSPIPILRSFDEGKMRDFYLDFLGFSVDWTHRFSPDLPLYIQLSRGGCRIHLSEHHGDCCPGAAVCIEIVDLESFYKELSDKLYKNAFPALEEMPWGTREMSVIDPFGNRIVFYEPMAQTTTS